MNISVIMPAYNHERFVAASVQSVLAQTLCEFELIVIDDGSTDETGAIIRNIGDDRLRYFYQDNQGAHAAINRGIAMATGDYVAILNSDDIYTPERLRICSDFLENHQDYSVVISRVSAINDRNKVLDRRHSAHAAAWIDWYKEALPRFKNDQFVPQSFAKNILITTSNFFIRKKILQKVGVFHPLRYAHDWDMLLRLAGAAPIHLLDEVLLHYRIHDSNTVREHNSEARVRFEVNWLVAKNLTSLQGNHWHPQQLLELVKDNHYLCLKSLFLLLGHYRLYGTFEELLSLEHPVTAYIIQHLVS